MMVISAPNLYQSEANRLDPGQNAKNPALPPHKINHTKMNLVVDIFRNARTFEPQPEPIMSRAKTKYTDTTELLPEFRIVSENGQPMMIVRGGPVSDPFTTVAHFYGRPVFAGDLEDHFKGLAIAGLLNLKMIKTGDDRGRFASGYGTKSPAGLWRSILEAAASAKYSGISA